MLSFEFAILNFIQGHMRSNFLDLVMPLISKLGNGGLIWLLLALALAVVPATRKTGFVVLAALALDFLCCNLIAKPLIGRIRPCDVNTAVQLLVNRPTDFSFPSGHTAASFTAVFALYFRGARLWKPALVMALLIAFSRLYLYVHYPSDILAGVLLGAAAAWCAIYLSKIAEPKIFVRAK